MQSLKQNTALLKQELAKLEPPPEHREEEDDSDEDSDWQRHSLKIVVTTAEWSVSRSDVWFRLPQALLRVTQSNTTSGGSVWRLSNVELLQVYFNTHEKS